MISPFDFDPTEGQNWPVYVSSTVLPSKVEISGTQMYAFIYYMYLHIQTTYVYNGRGFN